MRPLEETDFPEDQEHEKRCSWLSAPVCAFPEDPCRFAYFYGRKNYDIPDGKGCPRRERKPCCDIPETSIPVFVRFRDGK